MYAQLVCIQNGNAQLFFVLCITFNLNKREANYGDEIYIKDTWNECLNYLFSNPIVTIKDVQKATTLTPRAANNLVNAFVENDILY